MDGAVVEWVTEEDNYECKLSNETKILAKNELREDKNTRDQALEQMRSWIKLNPRIKNCRLGKEYLLSLKKKEEKKRKKRKEIIAENYEYLNYVMFIFVFLFFFISLLL